MSRFDRFMCWLLRVPTTEAHLPPNLNELYAAREAERMAQAQGEFCDCGDNPNGYLRKRANCPRHRDVVDVGGQAHTQVYTTVGIESDNLDSNTWSSNATFSSNNWYAVANANYTFGYAKPTNIISIMGPDSKMLVTIELDGSVTLHDEARVNEAAKVFWDAIYSHRPSCNCFLELRG